MYRCGKLTDVLIVYNIGTALQHIAAAKDAKLCISTWTLFCWSRKYNMDWNGARQILYPGPITCQGNLMKFIVISGTSCTKLHSIPVSSPSCARSQRVSIRNKFDCLISRDLQSSMHDQKGFLANTKLPCWTSDAVSVALQFWGSDRFAASGEARQLQIKADHFAPSWCFKPTFYIESKQWRGIYWNIMNVVKLSF